MLNLGSKFKEVKKFLDHIAKLLGNSVVEISLFGSKVRGENSKDSDIDVLVVVKGGRRDAFSALKLIYKVLGDMWLDLAAQGCVVEFVVFGEDEWKEMAKERYSFSINVEGEKVVVYKGSSDSTG